MFSNLMKKTKLILVLTLLILLATGSTSVLFGAYSMSNTCVLSITIYNSAVQSVTNLSGNLTVSLVQNQTNYSSSINTTFQNNGTTADNFWVKAVATGGISLVTTGGMGNPILTTANSMRLYALISDFNLTYTKANFLPADLVQTTWTACSTTTLQILMSLVLME